MALEGAAAPDAVSLQDAQAPGSCGRRPVKGSGAEKGAEAPHALSWAALGVIADCTELSLSTLTTEFPVSFAPDECLMERGANVENQR